MKKQVQSHSGDRMRVVSQSCPDCSGVLQLTEEGSRHHRLYCCQIGHRYSTTNLLHAKEMELERILWSAVVLLKQMADVYGQLLKQLPRTDSNWKTVQRRIKEVRKQTLMIKGIIETTHAAQ